MRPLQFLSIHKYGLLSCILVVLAAVLGADCGFAMAVVDPVEEAASPNPSTNMEEYNASTNPEGRPAGEAVVPDEQGRNQQLPNHAATLTDARDAGIIAEDYDEKTVEFRKFRFPEETIIAKACKPVKAKDYVHKHWVHGSTDLDAVFTNSDSVTITAGSNTSMTIGGQSVTVFTWNTKKLKLPVAWFDNAEILTEYSTVSVAGVAGYKKDAEGNQIADGELVLFVENHKNSDAYVEFKVINYPNKTASPATAVSIAANTVFHVMSTACAESQMHVASDAFIPTNEECFLQKKIETATVNDALDESEQKVSHKTKQILASAKENFKRKCARSHWNGTSFRSDVFVAETGQREAVFGEKGILRQIPMLYTTGTELTDNDLLAITTLMFTENASTDRAYVFCGKKAMTRFIKLVNSSTKYKEVSKVQVDTYGIKCRLYEDNFGTLEFIWAQSLDDLGYEEYMAVIDLDNAERPYLVNDKQTTRDMSKTAEAREAKEYNLCRIDCVDLLGHNAVLVVPSSVALNVANLGGIEASFSSVSSLPSGEALTAAAKLLKYYLTADNSGFKAGDVVEWDADLNGWIKFQGLIR